MAGQKIELGPTGRTVAENVKRVRALRSLNYADLSRKLTDLGRTISPLAVRRIEEGGRRVDVDDLLAICAALEVSPVILLSPDAPTPATEVEVTGVTNAAAKDLWKWFRADGPVDDYNSLEDWLKAQAGVPEWRKNEIQEGVSKILEINLAELEAKEGNPARWNRLLEERRNSHGDD